MITTRLAFDRSMRTKDADGRLHVEATPISKACVNQYRGSEIPNADALGLAPDQLYRLLRDPDELAKAAPTFSGLQVLSRHAAVSIADPQEKLIAGATGTDAHWQPPYVLVSLTIWRQEHIADVENRDRCQLSAAYYYTADMTPGLFSGQPYDGIMRGIVGNHVALVEAGRAGSDVAVHDGLPAWLGATAPSLDARFPSLTRIGFGG